MLNKDYYILLSMIETVDKIILFSSPYENAEEFFNSTRDFDAVMMNFIVVGETVDKLSDEFRQKNPQVNWQKIYAFRNIVAHHYFGINVDLVWQIIQKDIPLFRAELKNMTEN